MIEKFNSSDYNFNLLGLLKDKINSLNSKTKDDVAFKRIPFNKVMIEIFKTFNF